MAPPTPQISRNHNSANINTPSPTKQGTFGRISTFTSNLMNLVSGAENVEMEGKDDQVYTDGESTEIRAQLDQDGDSQMAESETGVDYEGDSQMTEASETQLHDEGPSEMSDDEDEFNTAPTKLSNEEHLDVVDDEDEVDIGEDISAELIEEVLNPSKTLAPRKSPTNVKKAVGSKVDKRKRTSTITTQDKSSQTLAANTPSQNKEEGVGKQRKNGTIMQKDIDSKTLAPNTPKQNKGAGKRTRSRTITQNEIGETADHEDTTAVNATNSNPKKIASPRGAKSAQTPKKQRSSRRNAEAVENPREESPKNKKSSPKGVKAAKNKKHEQEELDNEAEAEDDNGVFPTLYEPLRIHTCRTVIGDDETCTELLVEWKGYPKERDRTWEPIDRLREDVPDLVSKWEAQEEKALQTKGRVLVYTVEDILQKQTRNGKVSYLVKWEGFEEHTWEDEETLKVDVPDLVEEYEGRKTIFLRRRRSRVL